MAGPKEADQAERLKQIAHELECDEDEAKFSATLKKIAPAKPEPKKEDGAD